MKINEELFVIPEEENFILYTPLKGSVMRVNQGVIGMLQQIKKGESIERMDSKIIHTLFKKGIIVGNDEICCKEKEDTDILYKPTSVTLMPTFDCNLRCIYCYAEGGENPGEDMDFDIAKSAIDFVIGNARENNIKKQKIHLGFHGGGEPLLSRNENLINKSVDYFKNETTKYGFDQVVSSATNAVLSKKNLEWAIETFDRLNVSLDGTEDIQNSQRPTVNGKPSFDLVLKTIQYLEEKKFNYGIRATITRKSVSRMPEIVNFFHYIAPSLKDFHLEPLAECGRCKITKAEAPLPEDFLKHSLEARKVAEGLGVELYYSGSKLESVHDSFCGASGRNCFVTPNGNITTCLEVCRPEDERADVFLIGKYNEKMHSFKFDEEKITRLRKRKVQYIPHCTDCFAKYNCAGDCLAKIFTQSGNLNGTDKNTRCVINQGLLYNEIQKKLKR